MDTENKFPLIGDKFPEMEVLTTRGIKNWHCRNPI
jgi:hypothetical protein